MLVPVLALLASSCDAEAADALYRQHRFTEAGDTYRALLSRCPPSAELLSGSGRALLALGRPADAIPYLVQAAKMKAPGRNTRLALAQAFMETGHLPEADGILQELCASDPKDTDALSLEATLMYRNGYYQRSLEFLDKSLALKPDNPPAQRMRAVALVKVGRVAEGQAACRRLLDRESTPDLDVILTYTESLFEEGRAKDALPYADRAAQAWPENSIARFWRARLFLEVGRNDDALKDALESVRLAPQLPFGHTVLLQAYRKLRRAGDAAREVEWLRTYNNRSVAPGAR